MRLSQNYTVCEIAGEVFLMPVGNEVISVNSMISFNSVSSFIILQMKDKELTKEELVDLVYEEFEADRELISSDIGEFIAKGKEKGFIEE